ncbi:hypothetical protein NHQ30_001159 [Ciborinia camelliae]|nr:hypothetical protein NHQ30_001159 [Ciborinia camelliae]
MHHSKSIIEALGLCSEVLVSLNRLSQKIGPLKAETTRTITKWWALEAVIKMEKLRELQSKLNLRENDLNFGSAELDPPDMNGHPEALKREARALACSMKNPVMKLGFEKAMVLAFSELSNPLQTKPNTLRRRETGLLGFPDYPFSTISTPFETVHLRMITMLFADNTYNMRTTITMHLSRFMRLCGVRFGLNIAISKSPGIINHALRAYSAIDAK